MPSAEAAGWLDRMLLIREFESTAGPLATAGAIPGGMHSAIGHEAVAVGVGSVLRTDDVAAAPHRSHHVALAKGMDPALMMAELFGKRTGSSGGRGGHMHLADFGVGFFGSNGIVGAGVGLALGAALAQSYRGRAAGRGRVLRGRRRQHRARLGVRQPGLGLAPAAAGRLREQRVRGGDPDQRRDGG